MAEAFLLAACGTLGYAFVYNIPKKLLPLAAFTGAIGWIVYCQFPDHPITGCFLAALTVGILSEIFSRVFKDAATLFVLPGILPLVPGARMYRMTLEMLDQDFSAAGSLFIEVLSIAGSIAIALLLVTSLSRFLFRRSRMLPFRQPQKKNAQKKTFRNKKTLRP